CTTTGGATGTLVSTPSILERYSNFTNLTAPNIIRGTNQNLSVKVDVCGSYYGANLRAFIDWNQNGIFEVTEVVTFSAPVSGTNEVLTASVSIPCDAVLGNTLLRVVYQEGGVPVACGTYGWGETEDYAINIVDNPAVYVSSTAIQQTGTSSPGALDQKILRIPVKTTGCGLALATSFNFNTSGTTSAGDITSAKLYVTGNSPVFNTTKLVGTSVSPSGVFVFTTLDTLVSNDTTNYWLAYDVSSGATLTNVLDARLDSMEILGSYRLPTVSAPAGNIVINSPMTFVSTTATQNDTTKVGQGTASNVVIGMKVVMSATGSPVNLTQFNLDANGTTDTSNIRNLKVWYTGATNAFSMGTQFGSTVSVLPGTTSFTVTGLQALLNGDNYFWLSYDVTPTATIGNSIDAEFTSAIIASATQFPLVTSPVGSRQIRASYCASSANYTGDEEIINVTFGSLNNSSTCTTTGGATGTLVSTPSILERYSNYTNLAAPSLLRANTYPLSVKVNTCGSYYGATLRAFIDWNQNGLFDVTEVVTFSAPVSGLNEVITSYVTVPCDAVLGNTLLRVVYQESGTPVPCGTYGWGETEDYVINIGSNPVVYTSSTAIQQTGTSSPGALDQKILRIPVKTTGCGLALATSFNFNTAGSTSASDIATAKLYSTGNSPVFNTTKLVGTSVSPSGVFVFTTSDTLVSNDTTNYWLAYDVSSGATLTNVLDARLDSMEILGSYRLPTVSAPAGNIVINSPMTFVSATATQNDTTKVGQGTPNNVVMGMKIVMSASGSPVNLTQFNLDANGTTDTSNIRNLKVWYTGATNAFSMGSQFGSTVSVLPGTTSFTVTGLQTLLNGDNYFWLSYDITPTATIGNYVDAEFTSAVIASVTQFPLTSAPVGKRQIRADFCIPTYTNGSAFDHLTNVTLGTINNNSGASLDYIYYNNLSTNLYAGGSYNLTGTIYNGGTEMVAAWIDYNNDGIFSAAEKLGEYTGLTFTIPFTVALNATPGMYRLRVRNVYNTINIDPCINYSYGETEDYNVVILPAPYNTYTWNQTSPASFEIDANWTPSRTNINLSDKLQFNGGGSVVVNSVPTQQVSQIIVANNSTVTLNNTILSVLTVKDTLALTSGKIKVGANAVLTVGADTNNVGTITGTGNVEGKLRRWINRVVTSYAFPLAVDSSTRKATVSYSTIPDVSGYLTVNFIPGLPSATGLPLVDGLLNLANISDAGIWNAEANTTLSGGVYDITTDAANLNGVTNYQQTSLVVRATPSSSWSLLGSRVATSGSNSLMTLGRTGLYGGYGQVGIAGTSVNPLPVKTVDLVAVNVNNDVVVKWATLAEFNSKGFEVERSVDGKNFEFVTFVEGKGNSNSRVNYSILDAKAFDIHNAQVLYYRLKQVDLNGKFEYTNTVQVKKSEVPVQSAISVYPNPSNGIVNMSIESAITGVATVIITDMNGKEIAVGNVNVNKGSNGYQLSELKSVANGIYFVKVQLNGESKVTRISIVN
ncbi:MAG: T9SS type A sorting domain-containing protein, partial [Bacteroidia bacterium]|nr:T9SS type A sorting domain-containing protein [Bacteroidia bacterium]